MGNKIFQGVGKPWINVGSFKHSKLIFTIQHFARHVHMAVVCFIVVILFSIGAINSFSHIRQGRFTGT